VFESAKFGNMEVDDTDNAPVNFRNQHQFPGILIERFDPVSLFVLGFDELIGFQELPSPSRKISRAN